MAKGHDWASSHHFKTAVLIFSYHPKSLDIKRKSAAPRPAEQIFSNNLFSCGEIQLITLLQLDSCCRHPKSKGINPYHSCRDTGSVFPLQNLTQTSRLAFHWVLKPRHWAARSLPHKRFHHFPAMAAGVVRRLREQSSQNILKPGCSAKTGVIRSDAGVVYKPGRL